ncbi:MAG: cobalt-precorrin-5B (C(1))-methyltransferase, partial [Dehalococcoidia bacterium]
MALLTQTTVQDAYITLPEGEEVKFALGYCGFDTFKATCCVIKDAGDDPDITDKAEICATVRWRKDPGIVIEGGVGVGRVTKPGLDIPVGMAAINKVPREMIAQSVEEVVGKGKGTEVRISVPQGEELARKTLNPRLGITGGISIIGTSGIVVPYSKEAYTASISLALDIALANGCREIVLTTGRRSEKSAQREFPFREESFVQMGDFVGFALDECGKRDLDRVIIWGMIGKISKLAQGAVDVNVKDSRVDIDFLTHTAAECGVPESSVTTLKEAVTAHHFLGMLPERGVREVCSRLCFLACQTIREHTGGNSDAECVMSDKNGVILGRAYVKQ